MLGAGNAGDGEGFGVFVDEVRITFVGEQPDIAAVAEILQTRANSLGGITAPVGLLGELAMTIFVLGVMACSTWEARRMKKSSARVGAKTGVPPAYFTMSG